MFESWSDFYLVVGGAAAVLLGLIFVVVSLMHVRRSRHAGGMVDSARGRANST